MLKKSDFIAQVEYYRATNNDKALKKLQKTIVIGKSYKNYVLNQPQTNPFYVLDICYNGFKAEQIFQDFLNDHNKKFSFPDWTQDYLIQYGDPKPDFDGSTLPDLLIDGSRVDVKFKRLNPRWLIDDVKNWVDKSFINYKVEEITRKKIDYYVLIINFSYLMIIDCRLINYNNKDYKIVYETIL